MPPPRPRKLTAQPVRSRHFAGKPIATEVEEEEEERSSSSESEEEGGGREKNKEKKKSLIKARPAPLASSFVPAKQSSSKLASRRKAEAEAERKAFEAGFETESEQEGDQEGNEEEEEDGSGEDSGDSEESSEEESSSDEEEVATKLLRPVFVKKAVREQAAATATAAPVKTAEEMAAEQEARRQQASRAVVQEQIDRRIAEQAAGPRNWDDDLEHTDINAIDDADGLDPAAEYAAWKLRELKRIKRERLAIEEAEAEHAEMERRRNLSAAEREAEDRAFLDKQQQERDGHGGGGGQMQYMQKYFHKGAFFADELKQLGVDKRNVMAGARFEDQTNREVLPEFMQIRDMTRLGRKGRTRYKDMKTEDTGTWGDYADHGHHRRRGPRRDQEDYRVDERFRSDSHWTTTTTRGRDATGANAGMLGEKKRFADTDGRETKRARMESYG